MIGKIAGRLDYRAEGHVLIDVHGVGYLIYVSDRTMQALPGLGEGVTLYTELLVREDNLQLFGFTSLVEKEWHRLLISVQGIGAKASISVLGALGPDGVSRAIALGDWNAVKAAKGVGPKTAQRIVLELKDKAASVMAMSGHGSAQGASHVGSTTNEADASMVFEPTAPVSATPDSAAAQSEALSALGNLGYGPGDAASAVATALNEYPGADTATLIRSALKLLAPKS